MIMRNVDERLVYCRSKKTSAVLLILVCLDNCDPVVLPVLVEEVLSVDCEDFHRAPVRVVNWLQLRE